MSIRYKMCVLNRTVFFIVRPTTAALSHRMLAPAGISRDSCRVQDNDKRNGIYIFDWEKPQFNYHTLYIIIYYALLVLFVITFMQDTYNYIPETNKFSRAQNVADICTYNSTVISHDKRLHFILVHSELPNMTLFCKSFKSYCSGIFWTILRWFQLPLLLVVSLLWLHYTCAALLLLLLLLLLSSWSWS